MTAIQELDQDAHPGPGAIARLTQPGARADEPNSGEDRGLSLTRIYEYVWARYVEFSPPPFDVREDQALALLHEHYQRHPIAEDTECFYYGILAFERSFAEPARSKDLLERALAAFRAYRRQTSQGFVWEAVEDRYRETLERLGLATGTAH